MFFDWDDSKAESNKKKHGIGFSEAATVFSDPHAIEIFDRKNSDNEDRWILIGLSVKAQVLLVVYVEHDAECIRIISARKAIKDEIDQYFLRMTR